MAVEVTEIPGAAAGVILPSVCYAAMEDGNLLGIGGLAWGFGRCWLYLGMVDMSRTHPVLVVRWARRMLRKAAQIGETEVFCWRDDHPHSARLLELVGMELLGVEEVTLIDGSTGQKEVWKWRIQLPGLQSPPLAPSPLPA